jgi:hypothetical protein
MLSRNLMLMIAGLAFLMVIGCGKVPTDKIEQSDNALEAAQTAEAEDYAPDEYLEAKAMYEAAEAAKTEQDSKFALFRSYGTVGELYDSVTVLANKAVAAAEIEKDRVRDEVMATMIKIEGMINSASEALESAPRGKGTKADIELMKADLEAALSGFALAKNDFEAEEYNSAKIKLGAVMDNVQKLMTELENARIKVQKK